MNVNRILSLVYPLAFFFLLVSICALSAVGDPKHEKRIRQKECIANFTHMLAILETLSERPHAANIHIKEAISLAVELKETGLDSHAEIFQRKILEAGGACSAQIQYQTLKLAYLNGLLEMVSKSGEIEMVGDHKPYVDYRCAKVRARASASEYDKFATNIIRRWPTAEEAEKLRTLAKRCTTNYENAYQKAETEFDKMRLTAQWLNMQARRYYDADSQLLRKGIALTDKRQVQDSDRLKHQVRVFTQTVRKCLEKVCDSKRISPETLDQMADQFASIYEEIAFVGIPEKLFDNLLRDLPSFCEFALPFDLSSKESLFASFQWYLWSAIVTPLPDAIERETIDRQVDALSILIETQVDEIITQHPRFEAAGQAYGAIFRNAYATFKENRFVPYYKKAMLPHQFQAAMGKVNSEWDETRRSLRGFASGYKSEMDTPSEGAYMELRKAYVTALLLELYDCMFRHESPALNHLPKNIVRSHRSSLKDNLVFLFTVREYYPFPHYPWKKSLTEEEALQQGN